MKLIQKLFLGCIGSLVLAAGAQAQSYTLMQYNLAGQNRSFYFVPPDVAPKGLVILLHGLGGDAENYFNADMYPAIAKFKKQGYAFAILKGSNTAPNELRNTKTYRGWNAGGAGDCCSDLYTRHLNFNLRQAKPTAPLYTAPVPADDLGAIRDLAREGAKALGIEQRKTILIGISNGGIMAYRAQCNLPRGSLGAVISIQGALTGSGSCGVGAARSFAHLHGDLDTVVPYKGGETTVAPLYPKYLFPRSTMTSFNTMASASGCSFGASGEKAQISMGKANPASVGTVPYTTEVDWVRYMARCTADVNYNMVVYRGAGHAFKPSMLYTALSYGTELIK